MGEAEVYHQSVPGLVLSPVLRAAAVDLVLRPRAFICLLGLRVQRH